MTFEAFGFAEPLARALTQCGYATPTPIQVQALPPQLEGRDLLGMAETGSGKTATFVLPLLQRIAMNPRELGYKQVAALILAPTRELAIQIDQEVASLSRNMNIRRAVVLGGVSKGPQINALKRGVHVLVATPGRLLDHVNMRSCDLSGVETLVLDEADRMFDMGFIRDVRKIVGLIPQKRRTALFSATMPPEIRKFAYEILQDPYRVDLSTKTLVVDRIDQKVMVVRSNEKQSRLHTILADEACSRVIVFTRTKRGADRVAERLAMAGISASAFHGNKAQNARQRALNDFTLGHTRVLVATDIAARGIDVSNITHVVNFDMPLDPETYVHRVGRTARKGTSGIAISLCDPGERGEILAIERLMKQKIEVIDDVGGEVLPMPEKRPHHSHDAPRREGAHRKGPPRSGDRGGSRSGNYGESRSSNRGEPRNGEHRGSNRNGDFASRGRDDRGDRPSRPQRDGEHRSTPRHAEARAPGGEYTPRADRPYRERDARPTGEHRDGRNHRSRDERGSGPRPSDRPAAERHAGHRTERTHTERKGPDWHPVDRAPVAHQKPDRPHGERHGDRHGDRPARPEQRGHASAAPQGRNAHDRAGHQGKGKPGADKPGSWSGQQPPKFLKQRGERKAFGRPNGKPAA